MAGSFSQAKINHFTARGRAALKTPPGKRTKAQKKDVENFLTLGEPAESEVKKARKRHQQESPNPFKGAR